jgi:NADH-quinone oxidoreductase subunit F
MEQAASISERMAAYLEQVGGQGRTMLLPALLQAQGEYGYVPEAVARAIGQALAVPAADIFGVIEFYDMLTTQPGPQKLARVCIGTSCALAGAEQVLRAVCSYLDVMPGDSSADGTCQVLATQCLGLCEHAPAALLGDRPVGRLEPQTVPQALQGGGFDPRGVVAGFPRWMTHRCGVIRPTDLDDYQATGGFYALRKALALSPVEVIAEAKAPGLTGRGGAAFPIGLKLEGAARAEGATKYVVLNADESEPGTFKDRVLLEEDPFGVLEGMLIAGYAVGAKRGYAYVRGEYWRAQSILRQAIAALHGAGYLGENILGSDFSFEIEMRSGAGAYICGEETALFESIEGKRGFPRIKPPFPTSHGLFGCPTVINNVETFACLRLVFAMGAQAYSRLGTEKSPGTKLFCLSGDILRPGLYEFPFGLTLRELIYEAGGGIAGGRSLQAVLLGGAAGSFVPPDRMDVPLTIEDMRAVGLSMGSGAVMVFDDRRDLRSVLLGLGQFFAHESCGKCYPCQLGTHFQEQVLRRLALGQAWPGDRERLVDIGQTMTHASLCGLGQTAGMAALSAIRLWPELFDPHSR